MHMDRKLEILTESLPKAMLQALTPEAVDAIAARAARSGCLIWPPKQGSLYTGYYCGLRDPNGNYVEFSYGQPLGPGAEQMPIP